MMPSFGAFYKATHPDKCNIGRPSLVGMAAYGEDGVDKVLQIFKDEMEMHMRLMGTPTVKDMVQTPV